MSLLTQVPVVQLAPFLGSVESAGAKDSAKKVAESLKEFGVVIVRDPRVTFEDSEAFIDQMEDYFAQPTKDKIVDCRKHLSYQVGATPAFTEQPRCATDSKCLSYIDGLPEVHRPERPTRADAKWRFFWRIGERPTETDFPELNADQVIPKKFDAIWKERMDAWGNLMLGAVTTVAEMCAAGLDLAVPTFSDLMKRAPHLLAPTGSDLETDGKKGTILAGFHTDLNFLTIHGKSRYPGLHIWLKDGSKCTVKVPEGCLLVQAGQQLEYLTGGTIKAGFHEVVVTDGTLASKAVQAEKGRPLWRISSTLFAHLNSDQMLKVLPQFRDQEGVDLSKYPDVHVGKYVEEELNAIKLGAATLAATADAPTAAP